MGLWISWVILWIIFLIIELFILTFDFLALWFSSIITWILVYLFLFNLYTSSLVFLILWAISIYITRTVLLPKLKVKKSPKVLSDKLIWEKLLVQLIEWSFVANFEGNYWNLLSEWELNQWDTVEVVEMKWNSLVVKKVF